MATCSKQQLTCAWHAAVAVAVRLLLVVLGAGEALIWQPEVTTPANTALKTREGLALLQLGVSPYAGDSCHVPPLWLAVTAPVALHPVLCVVPNIVADLAAAAALYSAASALYNRVGSKGAAARDAPWLSATQLALFYLFNPFTIITCVAGTTTSAENAAVLVALAGGCLGNGPLAGFGLAVGAYLGLHPLLLLVPLLLMLRGGAEDPLQAVPLSREHKSSSSVHSAAAQQAGVNAAGASRPSSQGHAPTRSKQSRPQQPDQGLHQQQQEATHSKRQPQHSIQQQAAAQQRSWGPCLWCVGVLLASMLVLLVLSDQVLHQHPHSQCLTPLLSAAADARPGSSSAALLSRLSNCWAGRVYSLTLLLRDLTPNIGLWWYFFTEVFTEFVPFFLFVFHSFALVLIVPVAVRFPNRPVFVAWVQLFITFMFKPYACVGDLVPCMVLLPLLQQQLQSLKLKMFLVNSFVLLLVLGPAMWHQWVVLDSANANFFYSITLLLGVWCTVFLMQMLRLTVLLDRWLAGKGPPPRLVSAEGQEVSADRAAQQYAAQLQAQVLTCEHND